MSNEAATRGSEAVDDRRLERAREAGEDRYDVEVCVEPAAVPHRDRENGRRFADPASVAFEDVAVRCGQD